MNEFEIYRKKASELRKKLQAWSSAYYTLGRSPVSDSEYDRCFDELASIEKKFPNLQSSDSPTLRVGSDISSDFPEIKHSVPVLSLDKAYSADQIYSFIEKIHKTDSRISFVLEEKIDGFSIVLYYKNGSLDKAVTRGNGSVGNDVTANVRTIRAVPLRLSEPVTIAVRGEIYLPVSEFEKINSNLEEPFSNPRNFAAGTIRRNKSSEVAIVPLSVFCYEGFWEQDSLPSHLEILSYLKKLGLPIDSHISVFCNSKEESKDKLQKAGLEGFACSYSDLIDEIERRREQRKTLPYEIDGLVFKINEIKYREKLGYTEHHPRWALAYKFEAPQACSIVKSIDVQIGRTGRVTPLARIEPVGLSGSVIQNVTLHNQAYIDMLELAEKDTVAISKRGDVIPAVESVIEKNTEGNLVWKMPKYCPHCKGKLELQGAHHFCTNYHCPAREKGRLEYFCQKEQMNIQGLGEKTIEILYSGNYVKTIADIYTFDWDTLIKDRIEGFGEKKVSIIKNAVLESKKKPFRKILAGLGMEEIGPKVIEILENEGYNSKQSLLNLVNDSNAFSVLTSVEGIGPLTAEKIISGLTSSENIFVINQLEKLGLCMDNSQQPAFTDNFLSSSSVPPIFEGQTWCITGSFENFQPREKAMEEIKKRGGREVSSVSSKTSCLLAGKNAGSKLEKARKSGVRIVSEEEFMQLLNNGTW